MHRALLLSLLTLTTLPAFAHEAAPLPADVTAAVQFPVRVDRIVVQGLTRTRESVVLRELPFAAGETIDEETWEFGATRLWNATLFDHVSASIGRVVRTGEVVATYRVEENWTLNPLFSFAIGGNTGWVRGGASDTNVLGRFFELGAQYERFGDYNGFQAWAREPRFLGKRLDWVFIVDRLVRPRPDFADRRLRIGTEVNGMLASDRLRLTAKVEALYDVLLPLHNPDGGDVPDASPQIAPPPERSAWAVLAEWGVRLGRIDTVRVRQQGVSLEVRETLVATNLSTFQGFSQGWLELLAMQTVGERWNFAGRFQTGAQGNAPDYLQFYLGGLNVVRGYIDNFARTRQYALVNAEARFVAFDSRWVAIVAAGFVDAAVTQHPGGGVTPMLATGTGVRFLLPWMVKTGLRVDGAVPLVASPCAHWGGFCPNLSIGVFQFF